MEVNNITSKIEEFDPIFPCAKCIIKCICSDYCNSFMETYKYLGRKKWEEYRIWYNERRRILNFLRYKEDERLELRRD